MFPRHARKATLHTRATPATEARSVAELAALTEDESLTGFGSTRQGLNAAEAAARMATHSPNQVEHRGREGWWWSLWRALRNLLVILLLVLAAVASATGDLRAATVMSTMVVLGVLFRFLRESRADPAAARLQALIQVTTTVVRDGVARDVARDVALRVLVPGGIVRVAAGDLVPADVRRIEAKDLYVYRAPLTGESLLVEKSEQGDSRPELAAHERSCLCFLGTSGQSGAATALVIATGLETAFGKVVASIAGPEHSTAFDRGVDRFT